MVYTHPRGYRQSTYGGKLTENVVQGICRDLLATALVTVAGQNPDIYDRVKVHGRAWQSIGVNDSETFLHEPAPQQGKPGAAPPDPLIGQARMLEANVKAHQVLADSADMQRKAANEAMMSQHQRESDTFEATAKAAELASRERIENERIEVERTRLAVEQERAAAAHELAQREADHQQTMDRAGHNLDTASLASEHGRAMADHNREVWQSRQEHAHTREELAIKRKVANKPVPKPAPRSK